MASIDRLIPHLLKWEGGWSDDPDDAGGATMCGVTLATYEAYCRRKGYPRPTPERLRNLSREEWREIVKTMYWDRWRADGIASQPVANLCVDWLWMSGSVSIRRVQALLGVASDGIVGEKTLAALNSRSPLPLFGSIKKLRFRYIAEICRNRPQNEKFRKGWENRLNDMNFEE